MTNPNEPRPSTGSVTAGSGKVTARNIITGIDIQGAAGDEVLQTALETMQQLNTGQVSGAQGVEVSGDIVTGLRYLNPQAPTQAAFLSELQALRQELHDLATHGDAPAELSGAAESLDEVVAETQKEKPLAKRIVNRLRETVELITDASKALEAAGQAGPLILQALGTATILYQAAQALF